MSKTAEWIALTLVVVGAVNWGLVGLAPVRFGSRIVRRAVGARKPNCVWAGRARWNCTRRATFARRAGAPAIGYGAPLSDTRTGR
jgi:hypothetical protein